MAINPDRDNPRIFEDISVEPGRIFEPNNRLRRWAFASEAGKRAAHVCAEFDAFKSIGDLTDVRHFTFRPRPQKPLLGQPRKLKAGLGELDEELRRFATEYDRWVSQLVAAKLIEPLLTAIHIRFDQTMNLWDVHAHCIWRVKAEQMDDIKTKIQTKFSKIWHDDVPASNVAALINYVTQWIIDHRSLQFWPDQALKEVWALNKPRFIRPVGAFGLFRRSLSGCSLKRRGSRIMIIEKRPRRPKAMTRPSRPIADDIMGYATLRLDRHERRIAIRKRSPTERSESRFQSAANTDEWNPREADKLPSHSAPNYSTTNTRLTPIDMTGSKSDRIARKALVTDAKIPEPWRWRTWGGRRNSRPPLECGIRLPALIHAHVRRREKWRSRRLRDAAAALLDDPG